MKISSFLVNTIKMMDFPMVMLVYQELFTIKSGVRKSHGVFNLRFGKVTDLNLTKNATVLPEKRPTF